MAAGASRLQRIRGSMSGREWGRLGGLAAVVVGLHVVGFGVLILFVAPHHGAALGIGVGLTAWGFGLRHAFDADHISAIDNTTRKLMADGQRPLAVGFFFSLGHSTIVFALSFGLAFFARSVAGQINSDGSQLHNLGGYLGTSVSAVFLYLIAIINLVILVGIVKIFREMREGRYDEQTLEQRLNDRGLINRLLGPLARSVRHSWQMYPIGLLFGLGFDTATEVGLLALAATAGGANLPWYAILCLPVIFAAGMSMMDTADGAFMSVAYGWAFSNPVRKVFYNLAITGLSVAVALLVGSVELVSIVGTYAGHSGDAGGFWGFVNAIDLNTIGFVIVAMFLATWVVAVCVWFFAGIEERWSGAAAAGGAGEARPEASPTAAKPLVLVAAQTWLPVQACLLGIGVVYLGSHDRLLDASVSDARRAILIAGTIAACLVTGACLTLLAVTIDRARGLGAWIVAVGLEAACLVAGVEVAHNYPAVVQLALIGLPVGALVLLLSPRSASWIRRLRQLDHPDVGMAARSVEEH